MKYAFFPLHFWFRACVRACVRTSECPPSHLTLCRSRCCCPPHIQFFDLIFNNTSSLFYSIFFPPNVRKKISTTLTPHRTNKQQTNEAWALKPVSKMQKKKCPSHQHSNKKYYGRIHLMEWMCGLNYMHTWKSNTFTAAKMKKSWDAVVADFKIVQFFSLLQFALCAHWCAWVSVCGLLFPFQCLGTRSYSVFDGVSTFLCVGSFIFMNTLEIVQSVR